MVVVLKAGSKSLKIAKQLYSFNKAAQGHPEILGFNGKL
jgi:hypothetical protein